VSYIKFEKVEKKYNIYTSAEVHALKGIDLEIEKGDSIAIIGPSGSGKSTLLHILGCIDKATAGTYTLDGEAIESKKSNELARIRNKKIGFVLQEFGLILNQTSIENVSIPLLFGDTRLRDIKDIAFDTLESMGIGHLDDTKVSSMSGGQRQRVAIARALVNDPDIILADEPTGALDTKTSADIMKILMDLNKKGKTLIIVTHNMEIAEQCKRVINIVDGLVKEGISI